MREMITDLMISSNNFVKLTSYSKTTEIVKGNTLQKIQVKPFHGTTRYYIFIFLPHISNWNRIFTVNIVLIDNFLFVPLGIIENSFGLRQ